MTGRRLELVQQLSNRGILALSECDYAHRQRCGSGQYDSDGLSHSGSPNLPGQLRRLRAMMPQTSRVSFIPLSAARFPI